MNDYFVDIGIAAHIKQGERACGGRIDVIKQSDKNKIIIVTDGGGSGAASRMNATMTSQMIITMLQNGFSIKHCAELLVKNRLGPEKPFASFTIMRIFQNEETECVQYCMSRPLVFHNGVQAMPSPQADEDGLIYNQRALLHKNDVLAFLTGSCKREDAAAFLETFSLVGFNSKTLATLMTEECAKDETDMTVCTVCVKSRTPVNILIGPPKNPNDADKMMKLFFSKSGKHIICGGTTASIAAEYLQKPLIVKQEEEKNEIPPVSELSGADLVTEGIITLKRIVEYAKNSLESNCAYKIWGYERDGASLASRILFEEATDINMYVGKAVNPAHQQPNSPINFQAKMDLVSTLSACLKKMGKRVRVSYF